MFFKTDAFCQRWQFMVVFVLSVGLMSTTTEAITLESQRIENLIQQKLPNTPVGIFIQDAKTGKILYERRAQEAFLPASTAKLITAASSLFVLGPHYQYETTFNAASNVAKNGMLTGNVYLEFSGDPSLTVEDLQKMVADLKSTGVHQIKGNLILDDTLFQGRMHPYGWMADDQAWYYAAPISTVILNENKIKLIVKPSQTLGEKADISLSPDDQWLPLKITQKVVSVTETEAEENGELNINMDSDNHLAITGCWPAKDKPDELKVAVQNPNWFAIQAVKKALKMAGITLQGKVMMGSAPKGLKTLAVHGSPPLEILLKAVLQDSNNIYTESLVKTIGVQKFQQGTFQAGLRAIREVLKTQFAIDTSALRLLGGSGGSRYDALTPTQLGRVLYVLYHNPEFGHFFRDILPDAGNSGTLKKRMESFDVKGVIRAKTGSMTGVSALAGYINHREQEDLIFVILINGIVGESVPAKQLENDICQLLVQAN